jgi:hypothetical protein
MFKYIAILALGIAIGYSYGWKDAQQHTEHVAERLVARIGGGSRDDVRTDVDAKMRQVETR